MKAATALVVLFVLGLPFVGMQTSSRRTIVFRGVTIIDVKEGASRRNMAVVVAGNRIAAVTADGRARVPADAQVIDAKGKFLIPGLWDMHGHNVRRSICARA